MFESWNYGWRHYALRLAFGPGISLVFYFGVVLLSLTLYVALTFVFLSITEILSCRHMGVLGLVRSAEDAD
jgi:predicted membrane protein